MQTVGAMVCDSHHVPSTWLEVLVVVSRYGIVGLEELAPVSPACRVLPGLFDDWHNEKGEV